MFNADAIMEQTVTEAADTVLEPIPEGEHQAFIKKLEVREAKNNVVADIMWQIDNPELEDELGRELVVKQGLFLDLTEGGGLDFSKGKNVNLGKLREALGQNEDGQPWNFGMMEGQNAYITVVHKPNAAGDGVYANVRAVAQEPSLEE